MQKATAGLLMDTWPFLFHLICETQNKQEHCGYKTLESTGVEGSHSPICG
jgi:hypothetical protein